MGETSSSPLQPHEGNELESGRPEHIGPYRILQVLGEGGMGVVYEAEQTSPVHRRVALKVVRAGFETRDVIARFDSERQALAVMSHESIAKVLDVGTSQNGRPYFVMEIVRGIPITEFCDKHKLSVRERVALFIPVCHGVQHAHQKGVIHRDLKPSNVLVSEVDDRPLPKIIDFGIAKATGQRLTDATLVTMIGQAMGTPAYMSPEQADSASSDIDTRTDVYSLGVMLYELLVGRLPEDSTETGLQQFLVRLAMRETNPPTPSARLTTLANVRDTLATLRATDVVGLRRALRGDLDWIVMTATDQDRNRRYATVNALAADLARYLADPPAVQARLMNTMGDVYQELGLYPEAESLLVRSLAERERLPGDNTADIAVNLTSLGRLYSSDGRYAQAESTLTRAAAISEALPVPRIAYTDAIEELAELYRQRGDYARSDSLSRLWLAIMEQALGPDDPAVLAHLGGLASSQAEQGRPVAAESLFRRVLVANERTAGPDAARTSGAMSNLAELHTRQYGKAEADLDTALALRRKALEPTSYYIDETVEALADLYAAMNRYARADSAYRAVLEIWDASGREDRAQRRAATLKSYAALLKKQGRSSEAEALTR